MGGSDAAHGFFSFAEAMGRKALWPFCCGKMKGIGFTGKRLGQTSVKKQNPHKEETV